MANNAALYDPSLWRQAGVSPQLALGKKSKGKPTQQAHPLDLASDINRQLRILDQQDAIGTFTWLNCPPGLTSQLIERILYYRGQGALFTLNGRFYFLPYTLCAKDKTTGLDCYGRFTQITPMPWKGAQDGTKQAPWITGLVLQPLYEPLTALAKEGMSPEQIIQKVTKSCVLLHDYTPQRDETNIPRQRLQDSLLKIMSNCIPFMNTALLNSTGVGGLRVHNQEDASEVYATSAAVNQAALTGQKWVPIVGTEGLDYQQLTGGQTLKTQEFLLAMQAMDNFRLSLHGLDSGGLFQKKSHMLEAQQKMNQGITGLVLQDRLRNRQNAAIIANTLWGTQLWPIVSEPILALDTNKDGVADGGTNKEVVNDNNGSTDDIL